MRAPKCAIASGYWTSSSIHRWPGGLLIGHPSIPFLNREHLPYSQQMLRLAILVHVIIVIAMVPVSARDVRSNAEIVKEIIAECVAIYHQRRPCACPEDPARNGRCGGRSAWSRPGGAKPRCYPTDVSATEIADYREGKKTFVVECTALPR
jgi:hypothetical protein